jgi:hypothetical protein
METVKCFCCGEPATHLYAVWNIRDKDIASGNGLNTWGPSCDGCDDPELIEPVEGSWRITGPIEMWPSLPEGQFAIRREQEGR